LGEVAAAEGVAYITVYMRYRALRQVLKARLGHTTG
jgi:hypothetical protein